MPEMFYRSILEAAGPNPRHVAEVLGLPNLRLVRPDGVNIFADIQRKRCLRLSDVSLDVAKSPSEQIEYWCNFLQERIVGVSHLQKQAYRITIFFWIDSPHVDFEVAPEVMRVLSDLGVGLHFTFYVHSAAAEVPKERSSRLLWHPVEHSVDIIEDYLLDQLRGTAVREKVREKLDTREGRFFAILPEGARAESIDDWDHCSPVDGLGYPVDTKPLLLDVVKRFIRLDSRSRVLGQRDGDSAEDPAPHSGRNRVVSNGVPGCELRGSDVSDEEIDEMWNLTGSFPTVLFFYRSDSAKRTALEDRAVDEIAKNLIGMAVGVFLDDSYVIWWRTDLVPFPSGALAAA